jgi:hypothetical protein
MNKAIALLIGLTLTSHDAPSPSVIATLRLKEEAMSLEYTSTANEVVVVMSAESEESLSSVDIFSPGGAAVLRMKASGGRKLALSGYTIESQETSFEEFFGTYPEGMYSIRALTGDGRPVRGRAALSYVLPAPAVVLHPLQGAGDLPTSGLVIRWKSDSQATGYYVSLEQNENDGLTVKLPPGTEHFSVPDGILLPHTKTQVEVGVIGENGNRTLVEISCSTR